MTSRWIWLVLVAVQFSAGCQNAPPRPIQHGPGTYRDSVIATGITMYRLVSTIDSVAREMERLPSTLATVQSYDTISLSDVWARPFAYVADSVSYEIRSGGRDGLFYTQDDVIVLGRAGRNRPCELRNERVRLLYETVAPLCEKTPIRVLPTCPAADTLDLVLEEVLGPAVHDSVVASGTFLVRLARRIDAMGRRLGGLPPTPLAISPEILIDAWGRRVQYTPAQESFEIRSAGPDGRFESDDDVVVQANLGHPIPCAFIYQDTIARCADPVPQCPTTELGSSIDEPKGVLSRHSARWC